MSKKRTRKQKTAAQERRTKQRENELLNFLRDYGCPEPPQCSEASLFDNQIKSISTYLSELIANTNAGTIIDIGCGNGTILFRLSELDTFRVKSDWSYLGTDYPEYRIPLITLAAEKQLHRKVDFVSLPDFYIEWPNNCQLKRPYVIFLRNVLHELNIETTGIVLEHIAANINIGEKLIIQDLLVFPKAEKGNVCWESNSLKCLIEKIGFSTNITIEQSRYGGRWINVVATRNDQNVLDKNEIKSLVVKYRLIQWQNWKELGALHPQDEKFRDVRIAKIDFDLQFAALNNQLIIEKVKGIEPLQSHEETLVLKEYFDRALQSFHLEKPQTLMKQVDSVPYFVNRGNSKNGLEKFIVSNAKVTLIKGPPLMGKSELVKEVLGKFHHNRLPIFIDFQATSSVWNLIEGLLGSIGCKIPSEILSSLRTTSYYYIKEELIITLKKYSSDMIIVLDHFERLLNPGGIISDNEIKDFLVSLAMPNSKLIITSSRNVDLSVFSNKDLFPETQPPVGRFPEGPEHVGQLLGILAGIKDCPEKIVESIDRHPLLAVLTGLYIRKNGPSVLSDDSFIKELTNDMRTALLHRIADKNSQKALDIISHLRIPIPRNMLINLSSLTSVKNAEELGLLYPVRDPSRDDLISCIGAIKYWNDQNDEKEFDLQVEKIEEIESIELHKNISFQYQDVYRKDDDPKWLREIYYHKLLIGDPNTIHDFGSYFRSEIFGAGEYWFRYKKDFTSSFWAFSIASKFGENSVFLRMRKASCLIRIGRRNEGETEFNQLISEYPKARHLVSSFVDSLIFVDAFAAALCILEKHQISCNDGPWNAGQFGRIYMGLHKYEDAISAFKIQMQSDRSPIVFQNLARAYHKIGATINELKILETGLTENPKSRRLNIAMAAMLERMGQPDKAKNILLKMFNDDPYNGWIIFPLIKSLCKCNDEKKAIEIFEYSHKKIYPAFLKSPIHSEIEVINKNFFDAIRLIDNGEQNEHSVGQKLEIYFRWAIDTNDDDQRLHIAKEGLTVNIDDKLINNVPTLFSVGKLAVIANEYGKYIQIKECIKKINPDLTDLQEFARLYHPEWDWK